MKMLFSLTVHNYVVNPRYSLFMSAIMNDASWEVLPCLCLVWCMSETMVLNCLSQVWCTICVYFLKGVEAEQLKCLHVSTAVLLLAQIWNNTQIF